MSVSPHHQILDLYCNETNSDVVPLDSYADLNVHWKQAYDESYLLSLLDSELDQVQDKTKSLVQFRKNAWLITAREEAINWILKVHACYSFTPETAYLSVNYLDRFISSHTLTQGKAWPMKLLAVACLSLAAKMEETKVPLLMDLLQMMDPRFMFKPKIVQRMELLVMAKLKWRLRAITPLDFAHIFVAKLSCSDSTLGNLNSVVSHVSDVIIRTCLVIDFLEFSPSTIAAAAVLWSTNQNVGDEKSSCFHKNINKEMVQKCYNLMKRKPIIRQSEHSFPRILQLLPPSPTCVLDHAATLESSDAKKP